MTVMGRILTTVFVVIVLAIGGGVYLSVRDKAGQPEGFQAGELVREDSRRLNDVPGTDATFVEFLDFECEACGAAFPYIEQLRSQYGDRMNFVVRYFPIQSHFNSMRAARAVEAAAQQGKFEAMYKKMYETQTTWSEQQVPKDDVFRGFATELGLDMAAWDAAYADPATEERIKRDVADGQTLGVQGTPTLYLNGSEVKVNDFSQLSAEVEKALAN